MNSTDLGRPPDQSSPRIAIDPRDRVYSHEGSIEMIFRQPIPRTAAGNVISVYEKNRFL
jgi:hypothetical protein